MDNNFNISDRISYFRTMRGFTVNKLANLAGISQSYLRDIELGKNTNPTIDVIFCLCQSLGISLCEFFDEPTNHTVSNSLIKEIELLNLSQQEQLRQFLHILRTPPHEGIR